MDIFINQEFRSLIPPLEASELKALEESILEEGVRDAIVTWNGYIVDGHNRFDVITKHNITDYRVVEKHFSEIEEAKIWIKKNQLGRRNLAPYLRAEYLMDIQAWEDKKRQAKENLKTSTGGVNPQPFPNSEKPAINVTKDLATTLKVSTDTASRIIQIHDKAPEEIKAKCRAGEISINEAYKEVTGKAHVSYANGENEWYTPEVYAVAAREVMGNIDVDPASTEIANRIIKAGKYYTAEDNGLTKEWTGNIWMNPPYSQPLVTEFCNLLADKFKSGEVNQACVLVNNATETNWYQNMLTVANAVCFIKGRVKFIDKNGNSSGAPLQGQTILYFGNNCQKFSEVFSRFGVVLHADK